MFELVHVRSGRRAALKILSAALSSDAANRFMNEAHAANMVRHPGVVAIEDQGQFKDGIPWLLMEYVDGETLQERIAAMKRGNIPAKFDPIAVLYQISHALRALHVRGVVHRDLKPSNIKLMPDASRPEGELAKLLDLGIAKCLLDGKPTMVENGPVPNLTRPFVALGTPEYMAPEQCVSAATATPAADIYALGVIAHELLTGTRPFGGSWPEIAYRKHSIETPPVDMPDQPIELVSLVEEMLHRTPNLRPPIEHVVSVLAGLGGRPASGAEMVSFARKVVQREKRLKRLLSACAGLAFLLLLFGAFLRKTPTAPPPPVQSSVEPSPPRSDPPPSKGQPDVVNPPSEPKTETETEPAPKKTQTKPNRRKTKKTRSQTRS